jgi:hypothetical protein
MYCLFCVVLCIVCVYVYCTTATGWLPNCIQQIYHCLSCLLPLIAWFLQGNENFATSLLACKGQIYLYLCSFNISKTLLQSFSTDFFRLFFEFSTDIFFFYPASSLMYASILHSFNKISPFYSRDLSLFCPISYFRMLSSLHCSTCELECNSWY